MIDLRHGDMRDVLPTIEAESVHSVVTDPQASMNSALCSSKCSALVCRSRLLRASFSVFLSLWWTTIPLGIGP